MYLSLFSVHECFARMDVCMYVTDIPDALRDQKGHGIPWT